MAKNGLKLIDAEMHVMVPVDLWERYMIPNSRPARHGSSESVDGTAGSPPWSLCFETACPPFY